MSHDEFRELVGQYLTAASASGERQKGSFLDTSSRSVKGTLVARIKVSLNSRVKIVSIKYTRLTTHARKRHSCSGESEESGEKSELHEQRREGR